MLLPSLHHDGDNLVGLHVPEVCHVRPPFTEDKHQPPQGTEHQCSFRALEMRLWRPHNIALAILRAGLYNAAEIDVKESKGLAGVQAKKGTRKTRCEDQTPCGYLNDL